MATGRMIAERWLAQKLIETGVRVYRHPAPNSASYPHISISLLTGRDVRVMSDPIRKELLTYDVSAWDVGTSSIAVNVLASKISKIIDSKEPETVTFTEGGVTYTGIINSCRRMGVVPVASIVESGQRYERDGGQYVIEVLT